jgi:uncharacterized protein YjbI with pentapeptide repeats
MLLIEYKPKQLKKDYDITITNKLKDLIDKLLESTNLCKDIIEHIIVPYVYDWSKKNLSGANLVGFVCTRTKGSIKNMKLNNCNFDYSYFQRIIFINCVFDGSSFIYANFDHSYFENCSFIGINMDHSNFVHSYFTKCNFTDSSMKNMNLGNRKFTNCILDNVDMSNSYLVNSKMVCCSAINTNLQNCIINILLHKSNFTGSNFTYTTLDRIFI